MVRMVPWVETKEQFIVLESFCGAEFLPAVLAQKRDALATAVNRVVGKEL